MGDPFKHVQSGDPLRIPAQTFNTMLDAARDFRARQHGTSSEARPAAANHDVVLVRNESGAARDRFDVVGLGAPLFGPNDNLPEFQNRPCLAAGLPELPGHVGRIGILLEPLAEQAIGRALVSGVTVARVTMVQASHQFAEAVHEDPTRLRSCHAGSVEILWKEAGTGADKWALVRLGGGEMVVRFELLANLTPGGNALARLPDDPAVEFLVYDTLAMRRGRARSEGYYAGSLGYARFYHDLGRWEILEMQPKALVLGALVNESQGVPRGDGSGTFAVDNAELVAPIGGILESPPTTARNPLKLRLFDNDPVFLFWNETDLTWDAVGRDRGGTLRHGKVETGFENQSADARREVTVKACDKDGGNVEGDPFTVLTSLAPGFATYLFEGDVVDYLENEAGDRIIQSKHHDADFGAVEWLAVDPQNVKPGWALCDGQNGTADLRGRFIVALYGGDGLPEKTGLGDEGDYANVGSTDGIAWHGDSFNGHPDHADHPSHRHYLDAEFYDTQGATAGADFNALKVGVDDLWTSGPDKLAGGDDVNWSHTPHTGQGDADDTENRPPFYVLAAIQRVS